MGLLQQLAGYFQAGLHDDRKKVVDFQDVKPKGHGTPLPPSMVSNSRTGQVQTPYQYYTQARQPSPSDLQLKIAQLTQLGQLPQIQQQQRGAFQNQEEMSGLQGVESPGDIPLQIGGSYASRIQPQDYRRRIQGF